MSFALRIVQNGMLLTLVVLAGCKPGGNDFVIANVRYLHGEKISDETYFIGITNDRISYIGKEQVRARRMIDGSGLVLTPGFIDVNSCGWLKEKASELKLEDGITTFLNAHGDVFDANAKGTGAAERLNYATSVGLIPVQNHNLKGKAMMLALEESLRYGAYTISLSPEYNSNTTASVIAELSQYFANKHVLFSFHTRYSSKEEELAGIREAIECAEKGNAVEILHITSTGATFHPEEARQMIDKAIEKGAKITYNFYPYTAWTSSIHRARFSGDWLNRYGVDFTQVHIFGEPSMSQQRFDELMQNPMDRNVVVDSIPKATVDYYALNTSCPIGTDSEANESTTHPRGAGSFTKFINDYVDTGRISFAQAAYRFSTLPARQFVSYIPELGQRGEIEVGKIADLILWDRTKIKTHADFDHPLEPSSGVVAAFVNGIPEILDGHATNMNVSPGRHLKGSWALK